MSNGWDNFVPAPIEVFHSEAMEAFHRRREQLGRSPAEGLDGSNVNEIITEFKRKICRRYGISIQPTRRIGK